MDLNYLYKKKSRIKIKYFSIDLYYNILNSKEKNDFHSSYHLCP